MKDQTLDNQKSFVVVERQTSIAIIRLNAPETRNALSVEVTEELAIVVDNLTKRSDLACIVFTGTKGVFASGANIHELQKLTPSTAHEFATRGQRLFQTIANAPQLTIAAINGYCMGGGLDLALACDFRCASPDAVFAHPGARLGIITGWGGTQRLPRLIGAARALEMFATGRRVTVSEAFDFGLVNRIHTSVLDCARELAEGQMKPVFNLRPS